MSLKGSTQRSFILPLRSMTDKYTSASKHGLMSWGRKEKMELLKLQQTSQIDIFSPVAPEQAQ